MGCGSILSDIEIKSIIVSASSEDVIPKSQNKLTKLNMVCDFAVYSGNALLNIYLTCNRKDYFALPSRGRRGWSALAQSDCV